VRRIPVRPFVFLSLILALGATSADAGSPVQGTFQVNNKLPDGWALELMLRAEETGELVATETAVIDGSTIPFSFSDIDEGAYRVRLSAVGDEATLVLAETPTLTVGGDAAPGEGGKWKAIGAGGAVFGAIQLVGEPPAERMILVRARRIDIDLEGQFPDQLNAFTVEVQEEEFEAGRVDFEFAGLSYGLYAVELIAYHYKTHTTQPIAALDEHLVIDIDHQEHAEIEFEVDFQVTGD